MFCDDEPEELPWDYFLTNYERDLLTLSIEEMVRKNPNIPPDDLKAEMEKLKISQAVYEGFELPR
jgi:hypothetical protein